MKINLNEINEYPTNSRDYLLKLIIQVLILRAPNKSKK